LGGYESYEENGLEDPLNYFTEQASLAALSTLTHFYTLPQDVVMLLVVERWGNANLDIY
jgi:hypothetical protein